MKLRRIKELGRAAVGVLALALGGSSLGAAPATAASADFTYQVTRNADTYLDVPGTEIGFDALMRRAFGPVVPALLHGPGLGARGR